MRSRPVAALGLLLAAAALCPAQPTPGYSRALPPAATTLEKLNLKAEWAVNVPIDGKRDSVDLVQTFDDQLFVQTRTGLLIVVDALTGRIQWSASLGNGGYTNVYPLAVNSQFVFVTNVTRLFAFYRYTGVTEFVVDMQTVEMTGLAADESGVYAVLAGRPGAAAAHRVVAFNLPRPIAVADAARNADLPPTQRDAKLVNPVEDLTRRYPSPGAIRTAPEEMERTSGRGRLAVGEANTGGMTGSRTPSLAALPRVTPPYTLEGMPTSPSLATLPSLRQPYHLRGTDGRDMQRTPSIGTIPPSVAAALALADLRPHGVAPPVRWEYGLGGRVVYTPALTPYRLWMVTDDGHLMALSKVDKAREVYERPAAMPVAPMGRAGTTGYVPLADGELFALELLRGNQFGGLNVLWRVNVGGLLNHTPVVTEDAVYASGDDSGVVRVNRDSGTVVWRTDRSADRVLAVNEEFVYIRDRQGRLHVYDARRATDPVNKRSVPLTSLNLPEFNVPVVNTVSDRLYLVADNGLIVCVRDASPKYTRPVRVEPPATVNPPRKGGVSLETGEGAKGDMPPAPGGMDKKEPAPPPADKKEPAPPKAGTDKKDTTPKGGADKKGPPAKGGADKKQ